MVTVFESSTHASAAVDVHTLAVVCSCLFLDDKVKTL